MRYNEAHKYLSAILDLLKTMTEAGAEIYRIEESAVRMLEAYGVQNADVYATTSNIILSVETDDGLIKTHSRRIKAITTNIERVHQLNDLVRRITAEKPDADFIRQEVERIKGLPAYPVWVNIVFYGVIAGAFYLFFGGRSVAELFYSMGVGLVTGVISTLTDKAGTNKFMIKFLCSLSASLIIFTLKATGLANDIDSMIIANIMTLIPGIGLTNSLRDLFVGDSVSGILRLIEVALLALAIACGYILTTIVFGGVAQ